MNKFYRSSIDEVPAGVIHVETGEHGHMTEVTYDEKCANKPINMERVTTFEKGSHRYTIPTTPHSVEYPTIVFKNEDQKTIHWWHYPPNSLGWETRDSDFDFISRRVCTHCTRYDKTPSDSDELI